jgi:hypothetical protein
MRAQICYGVLGLHKSSICERRWSTLERGENYIYPEY